MIETTQAIEQSIAETFRGYGYSAKVKNGKVYVKSPEGITHMRNVVTIMGSNEIPLSYKTEYSGKSSVSIEVPLP